MKLENFDDNSLHQNLKQAAQLEDAVIDQVSKQTSLRLLGDENLNRSTLSSVETERRATLNVLLHLAEVERRRLYSKYRYDSLFSYCVGELKMSDPHAARRVNASRLITQLPLLEEKMQNGSVSLTTVSQSYSFFSKERKAGNVISNEAKLEILSTLESQTTRRVDQILLSHSSSPRIHLKESVKQKTETLTEIKLVVTDELLNKLNHLKAIWSHALPGASFALLIEKMTDIVIEKVDPVKKAERAIKKRTQKQTVTPAPECATNQARKHAHALDLDLDLDSESNSKMESKEVMSENKPATPICSPTKLPHISPPKSRTRYNQAFVEHTVRLRDQGCCTFVDARTGEICGSKWNLEFDHIIPFAMGSESSVENLRLRCRAHNQRHAVDSFGPYVTKFYERRH